MPGIGDGGEMGWGGWSGQRDLSIGESSSHDGTSPVLNLEEVGREE